LVRQELRESQKIVTIRPLAGTRPRGATPEEDARLATELLADPKEIAEHVMLIDLARNDVGRIAKTGTVKVTDSMVIEKYSHVQHIVSSVEAELLDNMSNMNVLRATFPAGTLSGAPKIRAMEIIDEMEITKRGIYGGAAGYLSFSGDIVIRTGVIHDGMLHSQAGAGIVADSDPAAEWRETEAKARAVLMAADLVQGGLDAPHD
jgi:anthranilate synthase component 1